jgi:hypothetical protein
VPCMYKCPCYWTPHWDCVASFSYQGRSYHGCTSENSPGVAGAGWCSIDSVFSGHFRYCGWICPKDSSSSRQPTYPEQAGGTTSMTPIKFGPVAAIGAGVGAGATALGLGIYGVVQAAKAPVATTQQPGFFVAAPRLVSGVQDIRQAGVVQTTPPPIQGFVLPVTIGVAVCALCCVLAVVSALCCRRAQNKQRDAASGVQLASVRRDDYPSGSEDNWPLLPTGNW